MNQSLAMKIFTEGTQTWFYFGVIFIFSILSLLSSGLIVNYFVNLNRFKNETNRLLACGRAAKVKVMEVEMIYRRYHKYPKVQIKVEIRDGGQNHVVSTRIFAPISHLSNLQVWREIPVKIDPSDVRKLAFDCGRKSISMVDLMK